jgi:hypothetical protein
LIENLSLFRQAKLLEHVGDFLPEAKKRAFFVSFYVFEGA